MFPAFMIGTGLGALVGLGQTGQTPSMDRLVSGILTSAAGSAVGAVLSVVTAAWWPPLIGPFVLSTACAMLAGLIFRRKSAH